MAQVYNDVDPPADRHDANRVQGVVIVQKQVRHPVVVVVLHPQTSNINWNVKYADQETRYVIDIS